MKITFGKDRYHLNGEMEKWCRTYAGEGSWTYGDVKDWTGTEPNVWFMHSMFGHTTFHFKDPKHYHWFLLRWT